MNPASPPELGRDVAGVTSQPPDADGQHRLPSTHSKPDGQAPDASQLPVHNESLPSDAHFSVAQSVFAVQSAPRPPGSFAPGVHRSSKHTVPLGQPAPHAAIT